MKFFYPAILFFISTLSCYSQIIDPYKFIATLKFDDQYQDYFTSKKEQVFPVSFTFNTIQDGNADSIIDAEDACENIVRYAIGDSIYGTGRTGLTGRGPNDQRPAVYFHFFKRPEYDVYEYWLYYADNDYLNDHEHDWEKYFVYVQDSIPIYAMISNHNNFNLFSWADLPKDDGHIIIGVDGGSHAMGNNNQNGVKIRYNGEVSENSGKLDFGNGQIFPWRIYTNDSNVIQAINYIQSPDEFFHGDPVYPDIPQLSSSDEYGSPSAAPWNRSEWDDPPSVPLNIIPVVSDNDIVIFPNPAAEIFSLFIPAALLESCEGLSLVMLDISGKEVKKIKKIKHEITSIRTTNLQRGTCYYQLLDKKEVIRSGKIILE